MEMLDEVVKRFPDTRYARDARLKYDLTRDHLAGKEMDIGRFYEKRGLYLAAINRFKRVVEDYQTTTHVPEALHRLVECYTALGVIEEAKKAAAVLGHNFPGSEWYVDSYQLATGEEIRTKPAEKGFIGRNLGWMWIF
jgi:outer membrane protein assembly factor BamD